MYRELQEAQQTMQTVQRFLHDALLSSTTREMAYHATQAQAAAVAAKDELDRALAPYRSGASSDFGEPQVQRRFVEAADQSLAETITEAQKIGLGVDIDSMRGRVIAVKTPADHADAFLRAALGNELR